MCLCCPRLNTFLELKMENERLQQRIADLRKRTPKGTGLPSSSYASSPSSMAPPRNPGYPPPLSIPSQRRPTDMSQYYPSAGSGVSAAHGYNGMMASPVSGGFEGGNLAPYGALYTTSAEEEPSEERNKKKVCLFSAFSRAL